MASQCFNKGITKIGDGTIVYTSATIKAMLVNSAYAHNPDNNFVSAIVANEITVGGYARQTLASKSVAQDDTNNRVNYAAANVTFSALVAGQTIGGVVILRDTGADATSELIAFGDTADTATNGNDVIIAWVGGFPFYGQI